MKSFKFNLTKGTALRFIVYTLLALFVVAQSSVAALTQDDINSILNGTAYYDPNSFFSGGGSCSVNLAGSSNEEKIWNYLASQKVTPVAAAGLMGNWQTESGGTWDPRINSGGDLSDSPKSNSIAYGIAQWLGSRQTNLVNKATQQHVIPGDLGLQLDFAWSDELNNANGYKTTVLDPIQSLSNGSIKDQVYQAAFIVYQSYEGPNDGSYPARQSNAWDIYQKFANSPPVGGTGSASCGTSCATSSTDATATSSSSNILCEAQKYEGIYYRSGGGHGYSAFRSACPESAISTAASSSTADSQGPCATDCSGLVSVAVDAVFNQSYDWIVSQSGQMEGSGAEKWQQLPSVSQAQPGDIVTRPDHVEIVQSVSGNTVTSFGSHETGKQTGPVTVDASYWTTAWHWGGS